MSPALLQYHLHSNRDKRLKNNTANNSIRIKNKGSKTRTDDSPITSSYFMDTLAVMWL